MWAQALMQQRTEHAMGGMWGPRFRLRRAVRFCRVEAVRLTVWRQS
jgi:hypothetical protein